ncbi:MAG: prephenate dehydratase [Pseudomonadota bacterium]|jgi:chorismate mutase/prephenate dehydratase
MAKKRKAAGRPASRPPGRSPGRRGGVPRVAYLGPEGTYSHSAVQAHFGESVTGLPLPTIEDVFEAVEDRRADFGVVPVENSSEGAVNITLDRLMSRSPPICGEIELRVHHNLLGRMTKPSAVKRVCAHPQALAQCRRWLDKNLPDAVRQPVSSNAEGARRAREEKGTAAIAGAVAAGVYGLKLLAERIEDHDHNTTRFLVLGRKSPPRSGADKTSLLVSGRKDEAGSLFRLLEPLARHRINMTRIESRPSRRRKWEYVFFIDVEGHAGDPVVARALTELRRRSSAYRVLGSYPRAAL